MCELIVCVRQKPETVEVRAGPTAASERLEGNHQHGNTRRLWLHEEAPSWEQVREGGEEQDYKSSLRRVSCINSQRVLPLNKQPPLPAVSSYVASPPTCPRPAQPSAPPRLLWSVVQSPDRCDRRGPECDPQTASLWARWSWAATASGSSPRWWSCAGTEINSIEWTIETHIRVSTQFYREISPPSLLPCRLNKEEDDKRWVSGFVHFFVSCLLWQNKSTRQALSIIDVIQTPLCDTRGTEDAGEDENLH